MMPTSRSQSPLRAPHIARPVNVPPPLANPSPNAPAVSVPKASSAYTAKTLLSPLFAAHSPSGSPSCHDVDVARNTNLLLQLGLQPVVARVSALPEAFVSRYTTFAASAASRSWYAATLPT